MKIRTDEIASVIKQEIEQFAKTLEVSEVGHVIEVGNGIARVYGLSSAMAGELLEFETEKGPAMGQVMNLETDTVGAVLYNNALAVREGDTVRATGRLLEVPVGMGLLGRVVDPLGTPIDAVTNRGYRLALPTSPLDGAAVKALLPPPLRDALRQGDCAGELDSTNAQLLARSAPPPGKFDFLTAEFQTAGRGRRGRS